jgi:hypothetical protein
LSQVLQKLKVGKLSARPGGMKVVFDGGVELETRKQLLVVLNDDVEDESLKVQITRSAFRQRGRVLSVMRLYTKGKLQEVPVTDS